MPLFLYQCEKCKAEMEILVRGHEAPACTKCGSKKLIKQASAFATKVPNHRREVPPIGGCESCPSRGGGGCPHA